MILIGLVAPKPKYMEYGGLIWRWVVLNWMAPSIGYWYSETDKFVFGLSIVGNGLVLDVYAIGDVKDKDRLLRVEWTVPAEKPA